MGFPKYSHDPDAVLDYTFKWADFLADINDHITAATVVLAKINGVPADDDAITDTTPVVVDTVVFDDPTGIVTAWVSGGTLGNIYTLTCHITTTDGREEDQSINLQVKEH